MVSGSKTSRLNMAQPAEVAQGSNQPSRNTKEQGTTSRKTSNTESDLYTWSAKPDLPPKKIPKPVAIEDVPDEGDPPPGSPSSPTLSIISTAGSSDNCRLIQTPSPSPSSTGATIGAKPPRPSSTSATIGTEIPEVMRYLDPSSPAVTPETIRRATSRVPNSTSVRQGSPESNTSVPSSLHSDVFSPGFRQPELHGWNPEHFENAFSPYASFSHHGARGETVAVPPPFSPGGGYVRPEQVPLPQTPYYPFAIPNGQGPGPNGFLPSPEIRRVIPNLQSPSPMHSSHLNVINGPPNPLRPPFYEEFVPARPPMSGYNLLAMKLSGSVWGGQPVTPIYRRFEALNHRILLEIQRELCLLEQELARLDDTDTNYRRGPEGIIPASRTDPGGMGAQQTAVLSDIGTKLELYSTPFYLFLPPILCTFEDSSRADNPQTKS